MEQSSSKWTTLCHPHQFQTVFRKGWSHKALTLEQMLLPAMLLLFDDFILFDDWTCTIDFFVFFAVSLFQLLLLFHNSEFIVIWHCHSHTILSFLCHYLLAVKIYVMFLYALCQWQCLSATIDVTDYHKVWCCVCTRRPIPERETLASTLRILATGESLRSAHFQLRHGEKTVQRYFHHVCQALFVNLKDQYMKVVLHTLLTV